MIRQWLRRILDIRLLFAVILLIKVCLALGGRTPEFSGKFLNSNEIADVDESIMEIEIGVSTDAETLQYYLTHWNESIAEHPRNSIDEEFAVYYGEGLPDIFFQSSANNSSLILADLSRCLKDFWITTCLKLLLLNRLDDILVFLRDNNLTRTDIPFMNGILTFKHEQTRESGANLRCGRKFRENGILGLDEDITAKMMELFEDRTLRLNLLPGLAVDFTSKPGKTAEDFVEFKAEPHFRWNFWQTDVRLEHEKSSPRKRSKGGFRMPSMMILPQLIMWGFMPFALANLQAMVMNAFMMNMMALNSAVFMTIRNLVFGPRGGPKIKYVNYGYKKMKKSSVPTLIIHSPAAFVKQPHNKFPLHSVGIEQSGRKPGFASRNSITQHYRDEIPAPHEEIYQAHASEDASNDSRGSTGELEKESRLKEYDGFELSNRGRRNGELDDGIEVVKMKGLLDGKNRVRIRLKSGSVRSMKDLIRRIRAIEEIGGSNLPAERSEKYRGTTSFVKRRAKGTKENRNQSNPIGNYPGSQNGARKRHSNYPNHRHRIALDQSASHALGEKKLPQKNANREIKYFAVNYDRNGFKPTVIGRDGRA